MSARSTPKTLNFDDINIKIDSLSKTFYVRTIDMFVPPCGRRRRKVRGNDGDFGGQSRASSSQNRTSSPRTTLTYAVFPRDAAPAERNRFVSQPLAISQSRPDRQTPAHALERYITIDRRSIYSPARSLDIRCIDSRYRWGVSRRDLGGPQPPTGRPVALKMKRRRKAKENVVNHVADCQNRKDAAR